MDQSSVAAPGHVSCGRPDHRRAAAALKLALVVVLLLLAAASVWTIRTMKNTIDMWIGPLSPSHSAPPRAGPLRVLAPTELLRARTFDEYRAEVDGLVERALALSEFGTRGGLAGACAYAIRGGKRLRPIIVLEICRAATLLRRSAAHPVDPADAALAIEYLHSASLIIDDLPVFDNDSERRGQPTVHAKSNPAVAQMAALSLVSAAFQNICRQIDWIRANCPEFRNVDWVGTRLCYTVSHALGATGAAGGQIMDATLSDAELFQGYGSDALLDIARLKTATFFEISFLVGWLVSGAPLQDAAELQRAGRFFGTAFQIADDIGDMAQDAARRAVGKPGWNFANEYGESAARYFVSQNLDACRRIMQNKKIFTQLWASLYSKVWGMAGAAGASPGKTGAAGASPGKTGAAGASPGKTVVADTLTQRCGPRRRIDTRHTSARGVHNSLTAI
jgi:geranylgeranyl diphosphate synthase type II